MKLKQLVMVSLIFAIIVPIVISTSLFSSSISSYLSDKLETSDIPTTLKEVRNALELELSYSIYASKAVAENSFVIDWLRKGEPEAQQQQFVNYLKKVKSNNEAITAFIVSDNTKHYYTHDGLVRSINASDGWFSNFINSNREFEVSIDVDKQLQTAAAFINYAIEVDGQRIAIGGVGRSLDAMSELIKKYKIGKNGYVFLTNANGEIQVHPDKSQLGQNVQLNNVVNKIHYHEMNEQSFIRSALPINSVGWYLVAEIDQNEVYSAINEAVYDNIILGVVVAAAGLLMVKFLTTILFKPIDHISKAVGRLTDKDGDLTARVRYLENNEIGELAKKINLFLEQLHNMFKQVSTASDNVKRLSERVADHTDISHNLSLKQSSSTQTVAAAVNELDASTAEISNNASLASNSAAATVQAAHQGTEFIKETMIEMQNLKQTIESSVLSVNELSDEIQSITSVLEVIRGISEQTNLLALNAAIEAARAGEQGRGFAVVADEVRTLAQRTAESTEEINLMITTLQNKAAATVSTIKSGSENTRQTSSRLEMTSQTFEQISHDINELTEMNAQVASATQEQSLATSEISQNIVIISDTSDESKISMEESAQLCRELDSQSKSLSSLIGKFTL